MQTFKDLVSARHEYAKGWKARTGGKVVGYLCTYVPEEIIYAAGMLPVRLLGSHQPQDVSERHIPSMYCSFCRDVLAQGLLGKYDYMDGLVFATSCLHIRQVFEVWQWQLHPSFSHYLYMPHALDSPGVVECWEAELRKFKRSLEAWAGTPITHDALARSVGTYNENRRLLKDLYGLRKGPPPLSGKEAMEIVLSSMLVDKREHNVELRARIQELKQSTPPSDGRPRLMLVGSENDDTEVLEAIESLGAVVVTDDHCTGSRYFWNEAAENGDPLRAIAQRYLGKPPCPIKDGGARRRVEHVAALAREYRVAGAVMVLEKFCHPHEWDAPSIERGLKDAGVSTLVLEVDVTVPRGQIKTRVEAFLEMIAA